jgi:hypothetical protein
LCGLNISIILRTPRRWHSSPKGAYTGALQVKKYAYLSFCKFEIVFTLYSNNIVLFFLAATRVAVSSHAIPLATITDLVIGKGTKDLRSSAVIMNFIFLKPSPASHYCPIVFIF